MKKIINILMLGVVMLFAGCNDWLEVTSEGSTTKENYYKSYEECRLATAPLYSKVWFEFNNNFYYALGDGRGNNINAPWSDYIYPFSNLTETGLTGPLQSAWQSFYIVINQADYVLQGLETAENCTEEQLNICRAEARFRRGTAMWYLCSLWKYVIIVEEPQRVIDNPVVAPNPFEDCLMFAIKDLEFAAEWLPETDGEAGRLTKWSGLGMLSKLYLTAACYARGGKFSSAYTTSAQEWYAKAAAAAGQVCEESELSLLENYEDLFKVQFNNNEESLFALQWVQGTDQYGSGNSAMRYLAHNSACVGGTSAWGNGTFAGGDMVELFHNRGDHIRRKATFFCHGENYDYICTDSEEGSYTVDASGQEYRAWIKKGVVGSPADTGGVARDGNSCLMTPMLRLADVYLIYAEALMGMATETADERAVTYFNKVRERAGMPTVETVTMAELWNERRCELCMEGQFWFDMLRRAYWDEQYVLDYMGAQKRNQSYSYQPLAEEDNFEWSENKMHEREEVAPSSSCLVLPYPESELLLNPMLKSEPVPYTFAE